MDEVRILAVPENLEAVTGFIGARLEGCPMKTIMQVRLAVEEIFINIANYAYSPETGNVTIRCSVEEGLDRVIIDFLDEGVPYNPLARDDPDIALSAEERQIGGLGIFMVKRLVDDIEYAYKDGKNILTIRKKV